MSPVILYGSPMSLYTGRARSYLIKAHIDYREEPPISRHYFETVIDMAGGRRSLPTIELPDGTVIRDGVAIVDHFENERGHPFSPSSPKQRIVSRLFDVIGAEGLIRPAMHYRWNFGDQNFDFLRFQFQAIVASNPVAGAEQIMQYMQRGENPPFSCAARKPWNHRNTVRGITAKAECALFRSSLSAGWETLHW